ncbi:hypothetical protein [Haladaptatus sp. NG-WS-4]
MGSTDYAKRLFRLPGVKHESSSLSKVQIEPEWEHEQIIRAAANADHEVPTTYADVLRDVFVSQKSLRVNSTQFFPDEPLDTFRILDSDKTVLEFSSEEREIETPLVEQREHPSGSLETAKSLVVHSGSGVQQLIRSPE